MSKNIAEVLTGVAVISIKYPVGGVYAEVGYTEDGVSISYSPTVSLTRVEEKTFPIGAYLDAEGGQIILNMSQSSLDLLNKAIAGALLAGSVISIGGGAIKYMSIKAVGVNPAGFARTVEAAMVVANGKVDLSFRKAKTTTVPMTFEVLDNGSAAPIVITDATS